MKKTLVTLLLTAICSCAAIAQIVPLQRTELFVTPEDAVAPYRIPAIVQVRKGHLLAVSDFRPCGSDIGYGRVDLRYRYSKDNGRTWTPVDTLIEGTGVKNTTACGYGDAAVVADRKSKEVLLLSVCGSTVYGHSSTTRQNPNRVARFYSKDGGISWEQPEEITEQFYAPFDSSRHGAIQSMFVGSGRLAQSKQIKSGTHYRIYAPVCARPNGNRVLYSDDFGRTWAVLGGADALPAVKGDEPKCFELPNGDVLLSSRMYGGRYFNIFRYTDKKKAEGEWENVAASHRENHGVMALRNSCNGGILIVPAWERNTHKKCWVMLQSVPLGPKRTNVGVFYKPIYKKKGYESPQMLAEKWWGPVQLTNKASGYSELELQKDGNIAVLMEEVSHKKAYTIVYLRYNLRQLTNGRFSFRK